MTEKTDSRDGGDIVERLRRLNRSALLPSLQRVMADAATEIDKLREALTEMERMYTHAWDREDGCLFMMPESVARFDEACCNARIALGRPLFGDNGEEDATLFSSAGGEER